MCLSYEHAAMCKVYTSAVQDATRFRLICLAVPEQDTAYSQRHNRGLLHRSILQTWCYVMKCSVASAADWLSFNLEASCPMNLCYSAEPPCKQTLT